MLQSQCASIQARAAVPASTHRTDIDTMYGEAEPRYCSASNVAYIRAPFHLHLTLLGISSTSTSTLHQLLDIEDLAWTTYSRAHSRSRICATICGANILQVALGTRAIACLVASYRDYYCSLLGYKRLGLPCIWFLGSLLSYIRDR